MAISAMAVSGSFLIALSVVVVGSKMQNDSPSARTNADQNQTYVPLACFDSAVMVPDVRNESFMDSRSDLCTEWHRPTLVSLGSLFQSSGQ